MTPIAVPSMSSGSAATARYPRALNTSFCAGGCGSVSTPAFDGQTLFAGAGQPTDGSPFLGSVYAFDPASQSLRWTHGASGTVVAPVTTVPGLVFVPTTTGTMVGGLTNTATTVAVGTNS